MSQDLKPKIDSCKKQLRIINKDIVKRNGLQQQGKSTGILDMEIKSNLNKAEQELEKIEEEVIKIEKDYESLGLTERDAIKNRNMYNDLISDKNQAIIKFGDFNKSSNSSNVHNYNSENKFTDNYDIEKMDNEQILQAQKDETKKQDEKLDVLIDVTGKINHVAKVTNQELVEQEVILGELEIGMDKNTAQIEKNTNKMTKLLHSSSYTMLIIGIIIEIALLPIILVLV